MKIKGFNLKPIGSEIKDIELDGKREKVSDVHFLLQADEQKFLFLYEKFLSVIADVGYTDIRVFFELCFRIRMGENCFVANNKLFSQIAKELDISPNTVRNRVSDLHKAGLLHRDADFKRNYYINSNYAWYGSKENMPKVASIILEQTAFTDKTTKLITKGNKITIRTTLSEEWISVTDKLPENGSNVMVRPENAYMVFENNCFVNPDTGGIRSDITHWIKLNMDYDNA